MQIADRNLRCRKSKSRRREFRLTALNFNLHDQAIKRFVSYRLFILEVFEGLNCGKLIGSQVDLKHSRRIPSRRLPLNGLT